MCCSFLLSAGNAGSAQHRVSAAAAWAQRSLEGSWIGLGNTAVLWKDPDSWNPAVRVLVQQNDSQQAPCASIQTHEIQEQWELNIRSTNLETAGAEEWTKAISCQLPAFFVNRGNSNEQGTKTLLLLPFLSSSSLNNSAVQAVDSWPLRAAQCHCHLHQTLLSVLLSSSPWNPDPVLARVEGASGILQSHLPASQLLPPFPVPCYRGDGWELTLKQWRIKTNPNKAASLPGPVFFKTVPG